MAPGLAVAYADQSGTFDWGIYPSIPTFQPADCHIRSCLALHPLEATSECRSLAALLKYDVAGPVSLLVIPGHGY